MSRITSTILNSRSKTMSSQIKFGAFEVTDQVFLTTPYSFVLVNLKPLVPGHVLVCPIKPHVRLTDLSVQETTDLFTTVQRVQKLLARQYLKTSNPESSTELQAAGSFNIAIQDGPEAGQTVPHLHVHIIPRPKNSGMSTDEVEEEVRRVYNGMQGEKGNVGGALWDAQQAAHSGARPQPGGAFPDIEDTARKARTMEDMIAEVKLYKYLMREVDEV